MLSLASATAASPAAADPIPGATYTGVAANGAAVSFTLSPDGTLVSSYGIGGVPRAKCQIYAAGDDGVWSGAPIADGAFQYQYYDAILFRGTFPGSQSAAGTYRLYTHATGATQGCDTGTVSWKATTATPPPPGPGGSGSPQPGGGNGNGHKGGGKRTFATRIGFRKLSRTRLGGQLGSRGAACRAGRTVILWRGLRRIARTRSKANGTFSFARTAFVRGHRVRVSSPARSGRTAVCAAGSSIFIMA